MKAISILQIVYEALAVIFAFAAIFSFFAVEGELAKDEWSSIGVIKFSLFLIPTLLLCVSLTLNFRERRRRAAQNKHLT